MPKVYVTDYEHPSFIHAEKVLERAGISLELAQSRTEDDVIANCGDADGLLVTYAPITRKVMENLPNCKIVVRLGIGFDCIDIPAATDLGVCAVNVPSYCEEEVADHALALLLACARKVVVLNNTVKDRVWDYKTGGTIFPLRGSVLGLVALGKIARHLAEKVQPLGMKVLGYDPFVDPATAAAAGIELVDDLAEMASQVDFLSVHAPLSEATRHLVNEEVLSRMKPTAFVINTARGPVIDEQALIKCLQEGGIAGAGLDVVDKEPIARDNPLLTMDNVILTPHVAWYSTASIAKLQTLAAEEVVRVLQGDLPKALLNPDVAHRRRQ
ncbi:MAG: C-terminal binding protein [Limnochordia bacterium]